MIVRFVGICGLADDHCLLVVFFIKKKIHDPTYHKKKRIKYIQK
jgi:hypothetical protein